MAQQERHENESFKTRSKSQPELANDFYTYIVISSQN
jgi:hypothetical protein